MKTEKMPNKKPENKEQIEPHLKLIQVQLQRVKQLREDQEASLKHHEDQVLKKKHSLESLTNTYDKHMAERARLKGIDIEEVKTVDALAEEIEDAAKKLPVDTLTKVLSALQSDQPKKEPSTPVKEDKE